jgi:hypothetical protein
MDADIDAFGVRAGVLRPGGLAVQEDGCVT